MENIHFNQVLIVTFQINQFCQKINLKIKIASIFLWISAEKFKSCILYPANSITNFIKSESVSKSYSKIMI